MKKTIILKKYEAKISFLKVSWTGMPPISKQGVPKTTLERSSLECASFDFPCEALSPHDDERPRGRC